MRYAAWGVLFVVLLVAAVAYLADRASHPGLAGLAAAEAAEPAAERPAAGVASVLGEHPPRRTRKREADNSPCYVCHVNYEDEEFVTTHAAENVGCVDCHGQSYEHRDDEDNVTPPDVLYGPDAIAPSCAKCHETHDVPAAKVIARWQERCPVKEDPDELVCTDCHGEHRLRFRTVWWDKKTKELVIRGENERIKYAPDLTKKPGDKPEDKPGDEPDDTPGETQ